MKNIRLAAFADEADSSVAGQIAALRDNGIGYIELRGIDGIIVTDAPSEKIRDAYRRFDDEGIRVWSVGSSIGKTKITAPFADEFDRFRRVLDNAVAVGAECLRLFSFYGTDGNSVYRDEVLFRLSEFAAAARDSGVVLCHENEKGIYGDIPSRCEEIYKALPEIRGCFDPANFIQCGADVMCAWERVGDYIYYLHAKDAKASDGSVVACGAGDGRIAELISAYTAAGGVTVTLEPHLTEFVGLCGLEEDKKSPVGGMRFADNRTAFDYAAEKLRNIVNNI